MAPFKRERGVALIVSLIMLVVLTLFVVTAINTSTANLKIVGSDQAKRNVDASAQQAIEVAITQTNFTAPSTSSSAVSVNSGTNNGENVTVYAPTCEGSGPLPGYSIVSGTLPGGSNGGSGGPQITNWDVKATVTSSATGAVTEIHQGVKVPLPASCL